MSDETRWSYYNEPQPKGLHPLAKLGIAVVFVIATLIILCP
jgi:hypothetical protein